MSYDEIYSAFYLIVDKDFFKLDETTAYDYMRQWLHNAISTPYIKELFLNISLDDEIEELVYELKNPPTNYPADMFIIDVFSKYMKIAWVTSHVDTAVNMATVIGGGQEKKILSNYRDNIERLEILERRLRKLITDYNSTNNDYVGGV